MIQRRNRFGYHATECLCPGVHAVQHKETPAMNRRTFIKSASAGAIVHAGTVAPASGAGAVETQSFEEPARRIAIVDRFDVIVCGGGPAGVCAALGSARRGARTLVIERNGCLGGVWTAGLLCWILDGHNKAGIIREITVELAKRNAAFPNRGGNQAVAFDAEQMKRVLEEYCTAAGVHVRLNTGVAAAVTDDDGAKLAITESKSGREAWAAAQFIDCTGDGDFAALAQCRYDLGESTDSRTQPMSLLALVTGVDYDQIAPFVRRNDESGSATKARLLAEIRRAGLEPSYKHPGLYPIYDNLFVLMANHEYGASALSASDVTTATLQARKEVHRIVDGLRSLGGVWKDLRIVATAEQIGVREGRRIHGRYKITQDDLIEGKRHHDAVCRVSFGVDVHALRSEDEDRSYRRGVHSKPYDVPLRALIAKDVRRIMMAGRCISGDFIAHSSYRVTGNACVTGEAAGNVAALAALTRRDPSDIDLSELT